MPDLGRTEVSIIVDTKPTRQANLVLVVDDDVFFRESVAAFLGRHNYVTLEAADGQSAFELAIQAHPAIAIVDIALPPGPHQPALSSQNAGVDLVRRLKQFDATMAVVLFSAFGNRSRAVLQLVVEGFQGLAYVTKGYSSGPAVLLQALNETRAGRVLIRVNEDNETAQLASRFWKHLTAEERELVSRAVALFPNLSNREREIARALAHGQTIEAVAKTLNISVRTVENHIDSIYSKLELDHAKTFHPPLRPAVLLAKTVWLLDMLAAEDET